MAACVDVLKCFITYFILCVIFCTVKRPCFTNSNACYNFTTSEVTEEKESFIYSSLWQYNLEKPIFVYKKYFLRMLLLLAGDIEVCPGPTARITYCGCAKTIRKNQTSGVCTNCRERLHLKCMKDSYGKGTELLFCSTCFVRDFDGNTVEYSNPALTNFVKKSGLKLFHQNINGILKNLDKIKILLNGTKQNIDILGISETHTNNTITNAELSIDGYTIERKDRQNGVFGGVLLDQM